MQAGFLGSSVAAFLAVAAKNPEPSHMVYFFAAGMTLVVTSVESSFSLAYTDELTGLPGRRSLNQALINLGKEYAIGMVDVDHFKKFNDRYGHKTGDQVLKMVASKLLAMSGGGKSFRYGGEEFAVIFPGKTAQEAVVHLDNYRKAMAATPFIVRGKGRRARSAKHRGKSKASVQKTAKLTVSIGVAAPDKRLTSPEEVLKAADKKLYKAKKAGRNRVVG
jgi:diguanylate cyclase (GGDEF)-like protein